ncbi:trans-2,3-dihydro-3-hydroxyanthranilate isomerase [Granulicella aggregans]|uniref:Trans-2,3-dihydro-3-hydroxyanthranilate isomerase n=1 Tax=Granulicella aggregans TaxID=474949 RepID=A0A7W7ZBC2_9BACT|nr:PhzF family phenazine biosynthesis protein [Granulicella aggregans]MBB5056745.1 trans-2,3-dihydro-3-hydroxyanthranilate isomerase [Granulicella aggregans]
MSIPPSSSGHARTDYALVDVFAESPLEGNMLAIFTDARHLSADTMQALARETNLAETTFIIPRDPAIEAERGVQVRIFTVQEELQFAGHPTLGTATWLYLNHPVLRGAETITLDLPVGPITVTFGPQDAAKSGVSGTMQQKAPTFGMTHSPEAIAAALGLSVDDLDPSLPIQTVSTGMAFCIVPLRSMEVASRLCIPQDKAQAYLDSCDAKFFYCITRTEEGSSADWHNRMQFYNGEDPATGSASGCTIAYLVHHKAAVNDQTVVFEQGIEINRPSRIEVRAAFSTDQQSIPDLVFVGGRTIPVASGTFFLP